MSGHDKQTCKQLATSRIDSRKRAESLTSYYRIRCEYGTSLMTFWKGGGGSPLYVCNEHVKLLVWGDLRKDGGHDL
jgi:hypothetical protein